MTDFPQPPAAPRPTRRPWSLSEIIAWLFILLTVAAVMTIVFTKKRDAAPDAEDPQMRVLLMSRYAVGSRELLKAFAPNPTAATLPAADLNRLITEVDAAATSPTDQLRAAILKGELQGRQAALDRLDALAETTPALRPDAYAFRSLYDTPQTLPSTVPATLPEPLAPGFKRGTVTIITETVITPLPTLRTRYGWFVDLAQSNGRPDSDPLRAATLAAGQRTVISLIAISMTALGGGFVGLVLLIIAIVLLHIGRIKPQLTAAPLAPALPPDRRLYVQSFAIYLLGMMFFSFLVLALHVVNPQFELSRSLSLIFAPVAFLAALCWPLVRKQPRAHWRAAFGLHANGRGLPGLFRETFAGLLGYLTGLPIFIAGVLLTLLFTKLSNADTSHPITKELAGGPNAWLTVFFLASLFAPITEELMFRGALFAHLRERFGWWISAPIVALLFASVHPQGWAAIPALASLALVFAGIREWRGSIVGCIAAHALHNTLTLLVALFMLS